MLINRNYCCSITDYRIDYLYSNMNTLPIHTQSRVSVDGIDLDFIVVADALISAFWNLSPAKRLKMVMILLYCSQPQHNIEYRLNDETFDFLYHSHMLDLHENGLPVTTKQGIYFLLRYLDKEQLQFA